LREAANATVYAPWLVANIHIKAPLFDRPGAAPAWDNVLYGTAGLGYVDAMHQSLHPVPGATVLTHYRALGDGQQRQLLLDRPWEHWRDDILAELALAHPDLPHKATRIDITRYGHAMATPAPQNKSQIGHTPLWNKRIALSKKERYRLRHGSLTFAHSDWVGYSVFEEAFTLGHAAGEASLW
jgi:hypothetical protein